jgi:LCP family protein required for cell wall assembly
MSNNKKNEPRSSIEIPKFINYEEVDNSDGFIKDVNSSLAKQIDTEFEEDDTAVSGRPPRKRKKRLRKLIRVPLSLLVVLIILCGLMLFTSPGKKVVIDLAGRYIYSNLEYQAFDDSQAAMADDATSAGVTDKEDRQIINILLIGIEEIEGDQNTDSMIIATVNKKDHSLKLTSLMRDLYVDIPGHDKGRLNSAYARGGIETLYKTIETNFGIPIDGYCMVNFKAFEQIVDIVGGVDITLTEKEAEYLRTTNYISKKSNRNVVAGTQTMNGNQALGYCRVRKVPTATESNDFGRTQRQRIVLQAIYNKLRSKNIFQQVFIMNDILKKVEIKTDVTQKEFISYLEAAADLKIKDLETLRIPSDGSYKNASVKMGSHKASVLQPKSWDATREEIHDFIYGDASDSGATE